MYMFMYMYVYIDEKSLTMYTCISAINGKKERNERRKRKKQIDVHVHDEM